MHAEHFLERLDRLDDHEVPDALALYYNPSLVRQLLAHAPERGHGDRVAISLDDPREGPFIIVTQRGDFVTTLGRGMSVGDLPVVPRSVWDAARRADERFSENFAQARAVSNREARLMWDELMTRGPYFSRESMSAALAFSRLLDTTFVRYWAELNAAIASKLTRLATREGYRALDDEGRVTLARRIWALGHLSVLVGGSEVKRATEGPVVEAFRELPLGSCSIRFGMLGPYLRALWATGKLGALTFDAAKRVFRTGDSSDEQLDAGLSLAIIGHRFRKYRGEVAKILAIGKREHEAPEVAFRRSVGEVTLASLEVVNAREDVRPKLQEIGARLWVDRSKALPADHPLRMTSIDEVPAELAVPQFAAMSADLWTFGVNGATVAAMLSSAALDAEELYFPRALADALPPVELAAWAELCCARVRKDGARARPSVTTAPKPGRNEPCSCGSGQKYKRCCGR